MLLLDVPEGAYGVQTAVLDPLQGRSLAGCDLVVRHTDDVDVGQGELVVPRSIAPRIVLGAVQFDHERVPAGVAEEEVDPPSGPARFPLGRLHQLVQRRLRREPVAGRWAESFGNPGLQEPLLGFAIDELARGAGVELERRVRVERRALDSCRQDRLGADTQLFGLPVGGPPDFGVAVLELPDGVGQFVTDQSVALDSQGHQGQPAPSEHLQQEPGDQSCVLGRLAVPGPQGQELELSQDRGQAGVGAKRLVDHAGQRAGVAVLGRVVGPGGVRPFAPVDGHVPRPLRLGLADRRRAPAGFRRRLSFVLQHSLALGVPGAAPEPAPLVRAAGRRPYDHPAVASRAGRGRPPGTPARVTGFPGGCHRRDRSQMVAARSFGPRARCCPCAC